MQKHMGSLGSNMRKQYFSSVTGMNLHHKAAALSKQLRLVEIAVQPSDECLNRYDGCSMAPRKIKLPLSFHAALDRSVGGIWELSLPLHGLFRACQLQESTACLAITFL